MFVSSPPSISKSRSFRFSGVLDFEVAVEVTLPVGDSVPDCVRACEIGATECALLVEGRGIGGRIDCFRGRSPIGGRRLPAMVGTGQVEEKDYTMRDQCAL